MASLNDVLKEILEKDFEKEDVEKVVDSVESNDENKETGEETPEESGETYTGPGDFAQNSVGRGAVESFIKNSVYEKYGIDSKAMKSFAGALLCILHQITFSRTIPTTMTSAAASQTHSFPRPAAAVLCGNRFARRSPCTSGRYSSRAMALLSRLLSRLKGRKTGISMAATSARGVPM